MMRLVGSSVLFAVIAATAGCGVGGGDDGGGGGGSGGPVQGGIDDPDKANGVTCRTDFDITGTFVQSTPPPTDGDALPGCWPVGTWTFTAAAKSGGCSPAPAAVPSYSFTVSLVDATDGSGQAQSLQSTTTLASGMKTHLKVTSTAQGCTGIFEVGTADGHGYWNMQPDLKDGATTLSGNGVYQQYNEDRWPWDDEPN